MELRERIDRFFTPRVVLVAGWIWFLVYAYPGFMTADSVLQLKQARDMEPMTDWHPPMMSFIWHYVDNLIAGPFGMLVIQSVAFLLGTYFIACRFLTRRRAAITAVLFLIVPNNIIVMAVVWKDALMAGFLMCAIAGLLAERLRWRLLGCFFVFLATAVRYNAVAGTLPLVVLLWDRGLARHWFKRYAMAFGVWLFVTSSALLVNRAITERHSNVFEIGAASVDVAGILHFAPEVDLVTLAREAPDAPWRTDVILRDVLDHGYKPVNSFHQMFDGGRSSIFTYPETRVQAEAIGALWQRLIREHPGAFVRHRLAVSKAQLECRVSVWHAPTMGSEVAEVEIQHRSALSRSQKLWVRANQKITSLKPFRPKLYFVLAIVLLFFTRRQRLVAALLLSGIANELLLFAVAPSVAYRYSHWMIACVLLSIVLLVIERSRASSRSQPG